MSSHKAIRPRRSLVTMPRVLTLVIAVLVLVFMFTPLPYVIRQPGPTFNAIGEAQIRNDDGQVVTQQVITINDPAAQVPTSGEFTVMTVSIVGNRNGTPSLFTLLGAWLDPAKDVLPLEVYYPEGTTNEQRDDETAQMMQQSQATAIAAAERQLGYEVPTVLTVNEVMSDGASAGLLQPGDVVKSVNGEPVQDVAEITSKLQANPDGAAPTVDLVVEREGEDVLVTVTPKLTDVQGGQAYRLGVILTNNFDFPIDVDIELGDVGGPSGGLIYAVSIVDELTPGDLSGGKIVAGTGTMSDQGEVGPIGGIRQKLFAAVNEQAAYFLAPEANCAEAVDGGVPGNLDVYAVATLDQALNIINQVNAGDTAGLQTCADVVAAGGGK